MKDKIFSFFNPLLLAVTLLTRIPLPLSNPNERDWGFCSAFFPITGALTAIVSSVPLLIFFWEPCSPPADDYLAIFSAISYLAISAWFTRGLHLDGFCDAVDAFSAMNCNSERRLEIMKDPHPGTAAVCALIFLLAFKIFAVYSILLKIREHLGDCYKPTTLLYASTLIFVLLSVFSRLTMTFLAYFGKYPRKNGTAFMIVGKTFLSAIFVAIVSAILFFSFIAYYLPLNIFYTAFFLAMIFVANIAYWFYGSMRMLKGTTGDILGAACESFECLSLLFFAVFIHKLLVLT